MEQRVADRRERVGERRHRSHRLERQRQHRHRVVHAGDEQEQPLQRGAHLLALLGCEQREDGDEDAHPDQRHRRRGEHGRRRDQVGVGEVDVEDEQRDEHHRRGACHAVEHREDADAEQVGRPAHRRHEGVLDGPLPAFPSDDVGDLHEDEREVAPEHRAGEQGDGASHSVVPFVGDSLPDAWDRVRGSVMESYRASRGPREAWQGCARGWHRLARRVRPGPLRWMYRTPRVHRDVARIAQFMRRATQIFEAARPSLCNPARCRLFPATVRSRTQRTHP